MGYTITLCALPLNMHEHDTEKKLLHVDIRILSILNSVCSDLYTHAYRCHAHETVAAVALR